MNDTPVRAELSVEIDPRAGFPTPVRMEIDFAPLLGTRSASRLIDPHTIVVKRRADGGTRDYPVQFAETLYTSNRGWVAWMVDEAPDGCAWSIECSLRAEDATMAEAPCLPIVGVGEELCYNGSRWQPIDSPGMHSFPMAVDWDGDGRIDVMCACHHSNVIGMPWGAVFFWKNIGSNAEPRFAPPLRLSADLIDQQQLNGNIERFEEPRSGFISEDYISCDTFDWFGSGRPDLITISRHGGIKVYRNLGTLDAAGLPELELAARVPFPDGFAVGRYLHVRAVDWDSSGRPSLVIGSRVNDKRTHSQREQIFLMLNAGTDAAAGGWSFRSGPFPISGSRIGGPDNLIADWRTCNFTNGRAVSFDVADVDGDGMQELLCCHADRVLGPRIEVWRNAGSPEEPELMLDGSLPWSRDDMTFGFRFVDNAAFRGCLRASWYSDHGLHYFRQVGSDPWQPGSFQDTGRLLGEGCKVKHVGMVKGDPIDPRGDGAFDLVCGNLAGYITLVRNLGTRDAPAFAEPERVTDADRVPVRVYREGLMGDQNSEGPCGQLKPLVCDWDGDGRLDILVGNNSNRIVWLRGYDPAENRYDAWLQLKVRGLHDPFGFRKGPAAADFDGDGRLELVAIDSNGRICTFAQGPGPNGSELLEPPVPLRFADGEVIMNGDIGKALADAEGVPFPSGLPGIWREPAVTLAACDWTETGTLDLIASSNWHTFVIENVGSNAEPRFDRPQPIRDERGTPVKVSQHESHVTAYDWDGDGTPDLIVGGESGGLYFFHHDWVSGIYHRAEVASST